MVNILCLMHGDVNGSVICECVYAEFFKAFMTKWILKDLHQI